MKKKILSIALALCMVLTMMPMATGVAWAAAGTPASEVTVGSVQMVNGSTTTYYKNGDTVSTGLRGTSTDYNAMYEPGTGTLTLKGLSLSDSDKYCIYANKALNIVLEGGEENANSLVHSGTKNIIYVEGNLTISGPGSLTAVNGSSNLTTIYATGNIIINEGAQVTATHAGGNAQAINAEDGKIEILGNGTTVNATHSEESPTASNPFALMADNISVSNGAVLTATSGKQAVSGDVSIDIVNSDVYAGDSAPGTKLENINSTDTYTAKYLKIEPKATVATALEDRIFSSAYDVQRNPAYPTKDQTVCLWNLSDPVMGSGLENLVGSKWTLTKAGTYSYMKSSGTATPNLEDIVKCVADGYSSLNPDTIVIHELKREGTHIAYGVVVAYDDASGYALFLGDTLSGGAGYLLSTNEISNSSSYTGSNPLIISAGTIATDFVQDMQDISIELSQTEQYIFPAATVGYINPETKSVTITNTGNTATGALTVALSGNNADSFTLNPESINSISTAENNKTAIFTVAPNADLAQGTYTATVTVSGPSIVSKSFDVSFKVKAPSSSGSYTPTIQKPTVITDDGAEGTLSFYGDKLTIKVADDYELVDVIVNGVSKGKVTELTGLKTGDKVEVKTEKKQEEPKEPTKEEIIAALKEQQMIARSKMTTSKSGRKAVLITWYDKNGNEVTFDGVEIYRSTKRDSGYGDEPIFVSRTGKYYNTAITEGARYYYKVRGYVIIDGQKYYTDYSLKAIRTIK